MLDIGMIVILIVCFGLFSGFVLWCDKVIAETGGADS